MHTVAVLALDRVLAFDLSAPIAVFGPYPVTRRANRLPGADLRGPTDEVDAGAFITSAMGTRRTAEEADTIICPQTTAISSRCCAGWKRTPAGISTSAKSQPKRR